MHAFIHSIHPKVSHMQLNASQRSVLRHEAAVASFKHEQQPTGVRRPAHDGLEAASRQTELGEKTQMSPSSPCLVYPKADRVISTFSFNPKPLPNPQNLHRGEASGPPESVSRMAQASTGGRLRSSGMSHEGYADPVTNDGPRFHSIIPVNELT